MSQVLKQFEAYELEKLASELAETRCGLLQKQADFWEDLAARGGDVLESGKQMFTSPSAAQLPLRNALIGAGLGGAVSGLSSFNRKKEDRTTLSDMLTGALAGAGAGGLGTYAYQQLRPPATTMQGDTKPSAIDAAPQPESASAPPPVDPMDLDGVGDLPLMEGAKRISEVGAQAAKNRASQLAEDAQVSREAWTGAGVGGAAGAISPGLFGLGSGGKRFMEGLDKYQAGLKTQGGDLPKPPRPGNSGAAATPPPLNRNQEAYKRFQNLPREEFGAGTRGAMNRARLRLHAQRNPSAVHPRFGVTPGDVKGIYGNTSGPSVKSRMGGGAIGAFLGAGLPSAGRWAAGQLRELPLHIPDEVFNNMPPTGQPAYGSVPPEVRTPDVPSLPPGIDPTPDYQMPPWAPAP